MSKRGRKKLEVTEEQAAEFYRMLASYNAAISRLPPNWRDVAEGKVDFRRVWTKPARSSATPSGAWRRRCSEAAEYLPRRSIS